LSSDALAPSPDSTPSDTAKSLTPVKAVKAGATRRKSPDADKNKSLKVVDLSGLYRVMGQTVRRLEYNPDKANEPTSLTYYCKSLLHYGSRICVDNVYWIPSNSGVVSGWIEAD
jgi:hypothetical protein